jgi:hypothetical protein
MLPTEWFARVLADMAACRKTGIVNQENFLRAGLADISERYEDRVSYSQLCHFALPPSFRAGTTEGPSIRQGAA